MAKKAIKSKENGLQQLKISLNSFPFIVNKANLLYITFFTEIEMKLEKSINSMEVNESQYSHFSWWLIFIDFLY